MNGLIQIHGKLSKDLLEKIKGMVESLSQQMDIPITLDIDSNGGLAKATQEVILLLHVIRSTQPGRKIIAFVRNAKSAAVMFVAVASERFMLPTSTLFLHTGARKVEAVDIDPATMQMRPSIANDLLEQQAVYVKTISHWMPLPDPYYTRLISRGKVELSAQQCKELGFAKIVDSFPIN